MTSSYFSFVLAELPRFFSQLDSNPLSKTYGSFDRQFWHLKRTDFSSSSLQQGSLVLACLYKYKFKQNPFFENPEASKLLTASLEYTFKLQHSDGSLDEWYPQERGWAGPTGYVLYSVIRSLELIGTMADSALLAKAETFAKRAVRHLLKYEEIDVLSNHQAMGLLAIEAAEKFFKFSMDKSALAKLWQNFNSNFSEEGWSLEYDGCDPGYQSATLSFLSRIHRISGRDEIRSICLKQINFLQNMVYPDNSFGGAVGSRGTENVFQFGFEYWANEFESAKATADVLFSGLREGQVLAPGDQEDHYLIYRLVEFIECAAIGRDMADVHSSDNSHAATAYFPESGILRISSSRYFGLLNLKKGGTGKLYSLQGSPESIFEDAGYFFEDKKGKLFTSSFIQDEREIKVEDSGVSITGYFNLYRRPVFTPVTFLLFRLALIFIVHSSLARLLKSWIRSKTMTKFAVVKDLKITRQISWNGNMSVVDKISLKGVEIKKGYRSFWFPARAVPQSLYLTPSRLGKSAVREISSQELQILNSRKEITLKVL